VLCHSLVHESGQAEAVSATHTLDLDLEAAFQDDQVPPQVAAGHGYGCGLRVLVGRTLPRRMSGCQADACTSRAYRLCVASSVL
jgi:hypothetical protein